MPAFPPPLPLPTTLNLAYKGTHAGDSSKKYLWSLRNYSEECSTRTYVVGCTVTMTFYRLTKSRINYYCVAKRRRIRHCWYEVL